MLTSLHPLPKKIFINLVVDSFLVLCYTESTMQRSITSNIKDYLSSADSAIVAPLEMRDDGSSSLDSIYSIATRHKLSLAQYVRLYPAESQIIAERNVAQWSDLLTEAIVTGYVRSSMGKTKVNKYVADLFKLRLEQAKGELNEVKKLVLVSSDNRMDNITQVLVSQAQDGNISAVKILLDRIDGKVGDRQAEEFDPTMGNVYKILHSLFDKQLEVINSGPGTKLICCSRRSGKTHVAAAAIGISALTKPNTKCFYISKTQKYAEKIFNGAWQQMVSDLGLKDTKGQPLNWKKLENGSEIIVRGLSNTKDPDSLRGFKAEVVVIDEFFHLKSDLLQYLQDEVLEPMQLDYATTFKKLLMGTPPKDRKSYGETLWRESPVPKFVWTWRDNPYIVDGEEYLAKLFKEKGIDPKSAFAQREYEGVWKYDSDFLVYPTYYTYNPEISMPQMTISKVAFGLDYGTSDQTTLIGVAWDTDKVQGYVFFEEKFNLLSSQGLGLIQHLKIVAKKAWRMALEFFPTLDWPDRNKRIAWYADYNAMAQSITQELNRGVRFKELPELSIQIVHAKRENSKVIQDKIRDLFRMGSLMLPEGGLTAVECELVSFKKDANNNPMSEIDHKQFHPELLTSLRYAMWDLVGRIDIGEATAADIESMEGIQYGGSLQADFEIAKVPQYREDARVSRKLERNTTGRFQSPYGTDPEVYTDFESPLGEAV